MSRQTWIRLLICSLSCVCAAGCDGVIEVKGTAVSSKGTPLDDCEVVLFRASDDYQLGRRPVDPQFSAIFTVMPVQRDYYAEVTCEGHSTYKSEPFSNGGSTYDAPVDLGTFNLQPVLLE